MWHLNRHIKERRIILHYLCDPCYHHLIRYPQRCNEVKKEVAEKQEIVECACGCGKTMSKYNQFGAEKKYIWSSHKLYHEEIKRNQQRRNVFIQCRCGCGRYIRHHLERGTKTVYYANGHYQKVRKEIDHNPYPIDLNCSSPILQRHNVLRLYGYLRKNGCIINDAVCKNSKQVYLVPLDGNHYNIDIENYVILCNSHRLLKAFRKLTSLAEILAIKHDFYDEFRGGKRRWLQKSSIPGIEMRKILSQEQGDFRRT